MSVLPLSSLCPGKPSAWPFWTHPLHTFLDPKLILVFFLKTSRPHLNLNSSTSPHRGIAMSPWQCLIQAGHWAPESSPWTVNRSVQAPKKIDSPHANWFGATHYVAGDTYWYGTPSSMPLTRQDGAALTGQTSQDVRWQAANTNYKVSCWWALETR